MEAEGGLRTPNGGVTVRTDRGQDGPPTSMSLISCEIFSQVVFPNTRKSYPPRTDIECGFRRAKTFQAGAHDWVGIFRVGWQTTKEYYTWVSVSSTEEENVLFKAYYLPKDDEYYQFCYVDQRGEVRGVSNPFQFREDEDDIVIVATQEEIENINEENRKLKEMTRSLAEELLTLQGDLRSNTEKTGILEKEYQNVQIQVNNLKEENETLKRTNLELALQRTGLQEELRESKAEIADREKLEAEINRLQAENEAEQRAVENLGALLDGCKEDRNKHREEIEVLTGHLEAEKKRNEELQQEVEERKMKGVQLEADMEKSGTMLREAEDNVSKLEQQLESQKKENAAKDEEMKKLNLTLFHLEANSTKLRISCEEHVRVMEKEKRTNGDLEELLERQRRKLLDCEDKAMESQRDLRSAQERRSRLEQELGAEQDKNRKREEFVTMLKNTIELREEELSDLRDAYERKRGEVDELHARIIQAQIEAPASASGLSRSRAQGLFYENPYEVTPPGISAESQSFERVDTRLEQEEGRAPREWICVVCAATFQDEQVYGDHILCHNIEHYDT